MTARGVWDGDRARRGLTGGSGWPRDSPGGHSSELDGGPSAPEGGPRRGGFDLRAQSFSVRSHLEVGGSSGLYTRPEPQGRRGWAGREPGSRPHTKPPPGPFQPQTYNRSFLTSHLKNPRREPEPDLSLFTLQTGPFCGRKKSPAQTAAAMGPADRRTNPGGTDRLRTPVLRSLLRQTAPRLLLPDAGTEITRSSSTSKHASPFPSFRLVFSYRVRHC